MKTALLAAALVVVATAAHADGYHKASGFEIVKAQCELIANQLQPSTFAFGVGPMLGAAIRSQITHAQNYDNCMTLKGYAKN
jgi:hypothetical protein